MSGDMDAAVEKAAEILCIGYDVPHRAPCSDCTETARAALTAIGLPALLERVEAAEEAETVPRSRHNRIVHQRDEWARRATEAEAAAGGEVGKLRAEIARLMEGQRDANVLARRLADALGERDTAVEEAEAATSAKRQIDNDLSSQIVTLELALEDVTAERDALAAKVARVEALADQWEYEKFEVWAADLRAALGDR